MDANEEGCQSVHHLHLHSMMGGASSPGKAVLGLMGLNLEGCCITCICTPTAWAHANLSCRAPPCLTGLLGKGEDLTAQAQRSPCT